MDEKTSSKIDCFANWELNSLTRGQHCLYTGQRPQVWPSEQPVRLSYPLAEPLPAPSLKTALRESLSYSSVVAVDLNDSQSFPLVSLSFQQWVISSAESEKGERGAGKGGSFRVQGSLASSPLFSFWQFPPSTWPASTLNPSRSMWVLGYSHTCHFSAVFFYHECLILWDHIAAWLWAWREHFSSAFCVYFKQPTWLCPVLPSFHMGNVSEPACSQWAVWELVVHEVCLFHQVLLS